MHASKSINSTYQGQWWGTVDWRRREDQEKNRKVCNKGDKAGCYSGQQRTTRVHRSKEWS